MPEARYKANPLAFPGDRWGIALCGFRNLRGDPACGGVLAHLNAGTDADLRACWTAGLAAGFKEEAPRVWKLTRHANGAHNLHHTPRRPKTAGPGQPRWAPRYNDYRMQSFFHATGPLYSGDSLIVYCPDHGHANVVRIADVERDIQAQPRRLASTP
jgi:hypothetical protein